MGHPTVYPTGTTILNKDKAYNGYTLFNAPGKGALLIDMNGREVHLWQGLDGFPNKMLPGGYVMGSLGQRSPEHGIQDQLDLVQVDWNGQIVWSFNQLEWIEDNNEKPQWMARQHHDYQREGNPVGYFTPELTPDTHKSNTLILCHENIYNTDISDKCLLDDIFIEVDWEGNIIWKWSFNEHFHELNFSEAAKNVLFRDPNMRTAGGGMGDYLHINTMSRLGPNQHFSNGDHRFHPDNIIWDSREANIIGITSRETGEIVWKIGPDFDNELNKHLGWIIGPHHAHMIPKGLPGEGNILIFDNGGWAGYGAANPSSIFGLKNAWRDYSRVIEINPVTLEIIWKHSAEELGYTNPTDSSRFYSPYVSSAQRLPNGNTLITEGSNGRLIEITVAHEIVWEYVSPYWREGKTRNNMIYRAYRIPYDWAPLLEKPIETNIEPVDVKQFRLPGSAPKDTITGVTVVGVVPASPRHEDVLCIATYSSDKKNKPSNNTLPTGYQIINKDNIDRLLNQSGKVLILAGANWCTKCQNLHKILPHVLQNYHYLNINYLDIDELSEVAQEFNIKAIPTLLILENGIEKNRTTGLKNKTTLHNWLQESLETK